MNDLNLTPTQSIILIIICLFILVLLWRYECYIELDITPKIDRVEGNTAGPCKRALRGIYFVLKQGLQLGGEHGDIFS